MKKILFFIESLAGGGAEKVLSDLAVNLDKSKYDITVATVTDEGVYEDRIKKCCKYYSFLKLSDYKAGGLKKIKYRSELKKIYNTNPADVYKKYLDGDYDIEIAFIEGFATKIIAASKNPNSRKIAWVHIDMYSNPYADNMFSSVEEEKAAYEKMDDIFCVSLTVKESFERKFFKSDKVRVQYNPVDSNEIIRLGNEDIDISSNHRPLLGSIGRLEKQKGYDRLVKCAGALLKEGNDFEIWIIGEGSMRPKLEQMINDYHLENRVKLIGFQKNPYKYMKRCDAFVCSSYAEGFSTAATESLILGKPVFTLECSGMEELFGGESCGMIVENTDEKLYELLKGLADKSIEIKSYEEAVKKRAKDFDIAASIKNIEMSLG